MQGIISKRKYDDIGIIVAIVIKNEGKETEILLDDIKDIFTNDLIDIS